MMIVEVIKNDFNNSLKEIQANTAKQVEDLKKETQKFLKELQDPLVVLCPIFLRNCQTDFPEWLYKLAIPPTMEECFSFSTSSPASAVT
jgi:NifB/MoaA-like Fe-S oxidoreductase